MARTTAKGEKSAELMPPTVMTVGTSSGQDLTFSTNADPGETVRRLFEGTRLVTLVTTDGNEVWLRPESIESVSYPTAGV